MQRSCEICGERFPVNKNSTVQHCLGCRREIQRARRQAEYESIKAQKPHYKQRSCTTCGNLYEPKSAAQKQCETCRAIQRRPAASDKPRRRTAQSIAEIAVQARAAGMSYGKYVAWKEGEV